HNPFLRYEPAVSLCEIAPGAFERARKLRAAFLEILPLRNDRTISAADLAKRGIEAYKHEFGFSVSASHWRVLFDRTIERDNGAEEWSRLEIYLEGNPPRSSH